MRLCYLATILLDRSNRTESTTRRIHDGMWHYANRTTPTGVMVSRGGHLLLLESYRPVYVATRMGHQFCRRKEPV